MGLDIPNADEFGVSPPKPYTRIDSDDYHSLFDYEESE